MRQQSFRGFGFITIMMLLLFMAIVLPSKMFVERMSSKELVEKLDSGNVVSVTIRPNRETPTGEVVLSMKGQKDEYSAYVSDVREIEEMLKTQDIDYTMENVPQESYMMTVILPVVLTGIVFVGIFVFMNMRAGGGGTNAKMMNFGKSRARMTRESSVNFSKVAGLRRKKKN